MSDRFRGKTVLVTGASSGIGRGLALACAAEGATLHVADVDAEGLERLASSTGARPHVCDVRDPSANEELVAAVGDLDVAFLNAGVNGAPSLLQPGGTLDTLPPSEWSRVLRINLDGLFYGLQACARVMKPRRNGSVVVTASTAGLRAEPRVSYPYVASKAAAVGLVKQAALELAPFGVRVNAIAPGPVVTNIGGAKRSPEGAAAWQRTIPLGRWGQVPDVVGLALLLASDDAGWMTGGIHVVDGGAGALTQITADELPGPADQ
ncbi:SDR family NAD(P)-dependent oxidoreductase [Cryptosporangium sp. NPDC048952]|uniref:SDR family NAD(P)-dependent oxidoreductase n=1 Tax=Cryptosporangium sp. NPDC048952 TaxID=3363961 RepID=UPI003719B62F